jgi:hypothetical protein
LKRVPSTKGLDIPYATILGIAKTSMTSLHSLLFTWSLMG